MSRPSGPSGHGKLKLQSPWLVFCGEPWPRYFFFSISPKIPFFRLRRTLFFSVYPQNTFFRLRRTLFFQYTLPKNAFFACRARYFFSIPLPKNAFFCLPNSFQCTPPPSKNTFFHAHTDFFSVPLQKMFNLRRATSCYITIIIAPVHVTRFQYTKILITCV